MVDTEPLDHLISDQKDLWAERLLSTSLAFLRTTRDVGDICSDRLDKDTIRVEIKSRDGYRLEFDLRKPIIGDFDEDPESQRLHDALDESELIVDRFMLYPNSNIEGENVGERLRRSGIKLVVRGNYQPPNLDYQALGNKLNNEMNTNDIYFLINSLVYGELGSTSSNKVILMNLLPFNDYGLFTFLHEVGHLEDPEQAEFEKSLEERGIEEESEEEFYRRTYTELKAEETNASSRALTDFDRIFKLSQGGARHLRFVDLIKLSLMIYQAGMERRYEEQFPAFGIPEPFIGLDELEFYRERLQSITHEAATVLNFPEENS